MRYSCPSCYAMVKCGKPYWVRAGEGAHLQGLLAAWGNEQRVYVVTVDAPEEFRHVQERWPQVMDAV